MILIGVSLKMYFELDRTLEWAAQVADVVRSRSDLRDIEIFVLPSAPALSATRDAFVGTAVLVGAQTVSEFATGAHTGEVSAHMLRDVGAQLVSIGHAERRRDNGETDDVVAMKVVATLEAGLVPLVCVGELHEQSAGSAIEFCLRQRDRALAPARARGLRGRVIIAYEPVWAIGAPIPAPSDHIRSVCDALGYATHGDSELGGPVIYGGAAGRGLLENLVPHVDGLFLGRFAHEPASFAHILDEAVMVNLAAVTSKTERSESARLTENRRTAPSSGVST